MRDFRAELRDVPCWSRRTELAFRTRGVPLEDCALQNRDELVALCEWIEAHDVRSYLEVGIWTGRLVSALHALFAFDRVAACDLGHARRLGLPRHLPPDALFLEADSRSPEFVEWRRALGPIDLVLIDADHAYEAVKADLALNLGFTQRFIALHDIANDHPTARGVKRLWGELQAEMQGERTEIVRPLRCSRGLMGIGILTCSALPRGEVAAPDPGG